MLYLFITTLIWAFSFGLIGNVLKGLDPLMIGSLRLLIALLVFLPFLRPGKIRKADRLKLVGIGAVQFGVMYICYLSAFRFIPSHLVALFSVLTPVYVVFIHDLREQHLNPRYMMAALLSVAGAAVIRFRAGDIGSIWIGFALMQAAGIAFAYGQVAYRDWYLKAKREYAASRTRKESETDEPTALKDHHVFGFLYVGGAAAAVIASLLLSPDPGAYFKMSLEQFGVILYLGVVASGLGFFLWNRGATLCSAGALAAFNNALPPVAIVVSLFVFREITDASNFELVRLLIGAGLVGLAVMVGKRSNSKKRNYIG